MARRATMLLVSMLVGPIGGCAAHHDTVMGGSANGVEINYVGDIAETLPLAQQILRTIRARAGVPRNQGR